MSFSAQPAGAETGSKNYHPFCGNGRFGIFSETGEVLIAPQYDRTAIGLEQGVILVRKEGKFGTVDLRGSTLLPIAFDLIGRSSEGLRPVQINGRYFYLNEKGQPAFELAAVYAPDFKFGFAAVPLPDGRQILIDHAGKILFELARRDEYLLILSPNVAIYMRDNESGWIDLVSREVHPVQADLLSMVNGVLVARTDNRTFLVDRNGRETRSIDGYVAITDDRKILVQQGMTFKLLEPRPEEIIDAGYFNKTDGRKHESHDFNYEGKHGLVNGRGMIILPPLYDQEIAIWDDGITMIRKGGREGLVDDSGNIVVPPVHENIEWLREGRIPVKIGGRWGFFDDKGALVIPAEYEGIHGFYDGVAEVKKDGRWLKINRGGKLFLPLNYAQDYAFFENDLLAVPKERDGCADYFDRQGNALFQSVIDKDGTERFIDVRRNKTIWSSKGV